MRRFFAILAITIMTTTTLLADEGMWLFNRPPSAAIKQKYGFDLTQQWLDKVQRAAVRFNSGGSGSFVSADGLVITNHHVGLDCLAKIGTEKRDYVKTGFHAKTRAEEVKCLDLELNVLMGIEDVTQRVNAALTAGMSTADSQRARRGVMNTIEKESLDKTGQRSDVVTLYQGGEYHLYRYKKYTDVRLAFAPEVSIAFFGGDPDNFEYPRYDLDIAIFRAYENDKPASPAGYLKFSPSGAKDGDLVFVAGHPGRTSRLNTLAHLEYFRDTNYTLTMDRLRRREVLIGAFAERAKENERRSHDSLFGVKNSRKAYIGRLAGLQDPAVIEMKRAEEKKLRTAIAANPEWQQQYGEAWSAVDAAIKESSTSLRERVALGLGSDLFNSALTLVRMADELAKPNAERLREYSAGGLESLKQQLYSAAPVYDDLETLMLADSLAYWLETMGPGNELVKQALGNKSPQQLASDLVRGTKLKDAAFRKQLGEGGKAALDGSNDPMIAFARMLDPRLRDLRKQSDELQERLRQSYARVANARFQALGAEGNYPDATFTLRLSYGAVKGFEENGKQVPANTTIRGLYARSAEHDNEAPFDLPKSWLTAKPKVNMDTPFNFVSTNDIIGGNSGSPVVNRAGEFVGIIFDGNLQSLSWDYQFDERVGRAVSVHSAGILEALRKVYAATNVLSELTEK